MEKYNPQKIEKKWQRSWDKDKIYQAEDFSKKPKFYGLIEFPYPSGEGLHVGHCRSYTALDIICRKKRMEGQNVLFPMGWDAFGLPTENYAIKTGIHPISATKKNTAVFKKQLKSLGFSFDWSREINTTDPAYYKWTQWIFLKLFENGMAYKSKIPINWCPSCKIGLANEEVVEGSCERCGTKTEQKEKEQWMLRITKYADRLIEDLNNVNFLEKVKAQQTNWIGRSEGTEAIFKIEGREEEIKVFTTRIDTIFGVTAIVLAPEHELAKKITKKNYEEEADRYIEESKRKNDFERTKLEKEKTGVFTGSYCVNPLNNKRIPIWLGDYVVSSYGGGAVMVVPGHDKRDYDFAKKHGIEIKEVIAGGDISKEAFAEYGKLINSGEYDGLKSEEAIKRINEWLEKNNAGKKSINYKLRDWVFSRQHYWGEPIPLVYCKNCACWVSLKEEDLPLKLPEIKNYKPTETGESPLSEIPEWVNAKCPKCKGPAKRETDVMPNWAGSNWYYLAYLMPKKRGKYLWDKKAMKYWMPVDLYNGGMEHTTLHLLYSRFIFKFLWDIGAVPKEIGSEPYKRRTSQGMILGQGGVKMSKSKGNVVNPNDVVKRYGADTLRLYEMFLGPFDEYATWDIKGIDGCSRFLNKVWKLQERIKEKQDKSLKSLLHKTIKKVGEDIESMKFNTAVSSMMVLVNEMSDKEPSLEDIKGLLLVLSPFAPYISQELWQRLGFEGQVSLQEWPKYDKKLFVEKTARFVIQVNGKVRDIVELDADISEEEAKRVALNREKIVKWIGSSNPKKIIFIPKKLVNIVI